MKINVKRAIFNDPDKMNGGRHTIPDKKRQKSKGQINKKT